MSFLRQFKNIILFIYRSVYKNKSGLNLIGYYSYTFGVAEVGRFFAQYVKKSGISISIFDLESPYHHKLDVDSLNSYQKFFSQNPPYYKNIFFVNADQISTIKELLPKLFIGKHNAAVFFWEFNDYFDFPSAFEVIDEVFAFTDFITTAIKKAAPTNVKVTKLPFPFVKNWEITKLPEAVRKQYRLSQTSFVFVFNFDFHSVYDRKNPEALVKAFEQAFSFDDDVYLILKTIHAEGDSKCNLSFKSLLEQMNLKEKIILVNENLDRNDFMNILNASDCYVSLHRSEGLGLGMLEAMSMGKPVIGTNYGGNTDFMNKDNSLLINYNLVPVEEDIAPYKAGWLWADADVAEAAECMAKVYKDRSFAAKLGKIAQESVNKQYSNDKFEKSIGNWMRS